LARLLCPNESQSSRGRAAAAHRREDSISWQLPRRLESGHTRVRSRPFVIPDSCFAGSQNHCIHFPGAPGGNCQLTRLGLGSEFDLQEASNIADTHQDARKCLRPVMYVRLSPPPVRSGRCWRFQLKAESRAAANKNRKKRSASIDDSGCIVYHQFWLNPHCPMGTLCGHPVPLFVRCFLIALLVLAGPKWLGLVSDARASFRPVDMDRLEAATESVGDSNAGSASSELPDPVPPLNPRLNNCIDAPSESGMTGGTQITSHAPGAAVGIVSEISSSASLFVTRLRLASERVATISSPSPVFEPPRAG
jgi:hypothetical protein